MILEPSYNKNIINIWACVGQYTHSQIAIWNSNRILKNSDNLKIAVFKTLRIPSMV